MESQGSQESRPPDTPPAWFDPYAAKVMSELQWSDYFARNAGYLIWHVNEDQMKRLEKLRYDAALGKLGGEHDGAWGQGWAWR